MREGKTAGSRCSREWQRQRQRQLWLHHSRHKVRRGARISCRWWDRRQCVSSTPRLRGAQVKVVFVFNVTGAIFG